MNQGVYAGGVLTMPQLFRRAQVFQQAPRINGGYDQTTPYRTVKVNFQDATKRIKDQSGNWVSTSMKTAWSRDRIQPGEFILFKDTVYRVMSDTDWKFQAGYFIYTIEKVVGDSGLPTFSPNANLGGGEF